MSKEVSGAIDGVKQFTKDSYNFLQVCEKPDVTGNQLYSYRI